jgi:hypothetical protein
MIVCVRMERERERERESCVCVQLGRVLVEEKIRDCPKRISKTTIIVSLSLSLSLTHTHSPSLSLTHSLTLSFLTSIYSERERVCVCVCMFESLSAMAEQLHVYFQKLGRGVSSETLPGPVTQNFSPSLFAPTGSKLVRSSCTEPTFRTPAPIAALL